MKEPVLKVEKLGIAYITRHGKIIAVEDLDFQLEGGSIIGIIGESGAGKTSVGLALAGLLHAADAEVTGRAIFGEKNLLALSEREMVSIRGGGIGMLFQDPVASLDPTMKVVDQVAEAIRLRGMAEGIDAKSMALEELARVGISEKALSAAPYAHMLSGGQCQRVQIAATLVGNPQLVIADEPTSSLDTTHQEKIIELLVARVRERDLAVIFISHDLPLVSGIADRVIVMREGRMVESGPCDRILSSPSSDFTKELIAASASPLDSGVS